MKTIRNYNLIQLVVGLFILCASAYSIQAQTTYPFKDYYHNNSGEINYVKPADSWASTTTENLPPILKEIYGLTYVPQLKIMKESSTEEHDFQRFYQMYGAAYVYGGDIIVKRDKSGNILAIVGTMHDVQTLASGPYLSKDTAVVRGIEQVPKGDLYLWDLDFEEEKLKFIKEDSNATYYPTAQLVYYPRETEPFRDYVLCYEMEIYTTFPARYFTYVEAATGKLVHYYNGIAHASSVGTTLYNGQKNFSTGKIGGLWYLHDSTRKIFTVDARRSWNRASHSQIRDGNNNFNSNWQKEGVSAHWAAGKSYDYFLTKFGRKSLDGKGYKQMQTVRYGVRYNNAFWSGTQMYYGSGNDTAWAPLVAVDDVGHECSHGTIQFAAGLVYQGESGALNEGWADIFGMTVENYTGDKDWNQSEDSYTPGRANDALRVMNNPNTTRDPDSYKGRHWKSTARGASDHGGVHSNSGVANFWFYLLTDGGNGRSDGKGGQVDRGNAYSVTGIGIAKSEKIAYRALDKYMANTTDYAGARVATLLAAEDLYGKKSNEYKQVCNAWYAVDVGEKCCVDSMEFEFNLTEPLCHDSKDGKIDLTVKKATGPFVYEWYKSDTLGPIISTNEDLNGVGKEFYVVIVKDTAAKCEKTEKVELTAPKPVSVSLSGGGVHIRACDRKPEIFLQATASGGTSPYTYNWPNGKKVIATSGSVGASGWYTAQATDKNGCKNSRSTFAFFIPIRCSYDPNDIIGPPAYGDQKWVSSEATLPYKVRFENDPKFATAPAQKVTIDHPLDSNTNMSAFRLGDFGFANYVFEVPDNSSYYSKRIDLKDSLGIYLDVTAGLDISAKKAFWIFESIDPNTGLPPADANVGFLAVNDTNTHVGEGFVDYTIKAKSNAVTGDSIRAVAEIVFDNNPPLLTPRIHNLVDAVAPTSGIRSLPSLQDSVNIPLTLFGEDDSAASGFGAWDLYVSENGGAYTVHARGLTDSTISFRGDYGHEYRFYTRGLDNVSNTEPNKTTPDLTITIAPDQFLRNLDSAISLCAFDTLEIKWNFLNIPSFDLEYKSDTGSTYLSLAKNLNPSDSIYSWIIPASIAGKTNYNIRAVATASSTPIDTTRSFELKASPVFDLGSDTSFCDGSSINLVLSPGSSYSTYSWSTGDTTSTYTATTVGTFSLTATNTFNCTGTDSIKLGTYLLPQVSSKTITHVSCFGQSDGAVDLTVVSGNPPYNYAWSSGDTTQDISNKPANTYVLTITDSVLCMNTDTSVINQPNNLITSPSTKDVLCFGGSSGEIDLQTSGGTAPYSYVWSNSDTTEKITGLVKGTYTVVVTDANNCVIYDTITISEPTELQARTSVTNVSCFGGNDGAIDLSVSGGITTYSYLWSNNDTTQDITGLVKGSFTVIVTDANGCQAFDTATLTEPTQLQSSVVVTDVSCNGGNNGKIDLTVSGGTTGYTYAWSNSETSQDIDTLTAGTYTVVITDANNCVLSDTAIVTQPSALSISNAVTNVSCNGGSTGAVNITVTGGAAGYTFVWSNGDTTEDITAQRAGTYSVVVTDSNACTINDTATITEPSAISSSGNLTQVDCNGNTSGAIVLTVSGGTTPYQYLWSNADTTKNITGLAAGTYTLRITDANACVHRDTFEITQPQQLQLSKVLKDITCFGETDGEVTLSVSGGTTPYQYLWSNSDTTAKIEKLSKGSYSVIVTDKNGCTYNDTSTINEPTQLTTSVTVTNVDCNGGSNGAVNLTVSGGSVGYRFVWSNGDTTEDISAQKAGTYTVTVSDTNSCVVRDTATISEPSALSSSEVLTMVKCNAGSDGAIALTVSGGTSPYRYVWSNSDTTKDISNLAAGTYSVVITDANACVLYDTFDITQPSAISRSKVVNHITCFGLTDGSISLTIAGGTTPYRYLWSNGDTTASISGLARQQFSVIVTDSNGCQFYDTTSITEPSQLTSTSVVDNITCFGAGDGKVDLTTSGGTAPYTWLWSNTATSEDVSNLQAGSISVVITDDNGCVHRDTMQISEPAQLVSSGAITNIKCNGDATGAVDVTVTGGTTPFAYVWSNSDTTQDLSGLVAGTYTVVITDNNGCIQRDSFTITQPDLLTGVGSATPVKCFDGNDGIASITMTGGTTPYTFVWSNGDTTATNNGLVAGMYTVVITDVNNCVYRDTITVTQPNLLVASGSETPVSCFAGADGQIDLAITGGTTGYTTLWSNADTTEDISGLQAGSYSVIVTDNNGCVAYDTVAVTEPSAIGIAKLVTHVKCKDEANGAIDITLTGGTPGYTVQWSNSATTEDITGLAAGSYSVIVTDGNNCVAHDTTMITEPDSLIGSISHTDLICFGDADGTVDLTVSGGTKPYSFAWSNSDTTEDLTGLSGGTYTVEITDSNNCMWFDTAVVVEPPVMVLDLDSVAEIENNANGKAWVTVTGGVGPYTYQWNDPASSTTDTASNLSRGMYTVVVTDANGCEKTDSINVPSVLSTGNVIYAGAIQVYPNPNQGWVGIYNLNELGDDVTIVLTDISGRRVLTRAVHNVDTYKLELPLQIVDGTYFLNLFSNSKTVRKQIILMR